MDRWSGKSNVYSEKKPMKFTRFAGSSDKKDKSVLSSSRKELPHGRAKTFDGDSSNLPSSSRIKRGFRQRSTSANRGCSPLLSGVIPSSFGLGKRSSRKEEYTIGDEVGRLHWEHTYHLKCVQEWLRMKSWCPICKTTAETSSE